MHASPPNRNEKAAWVATIGLQEPSASDLQTRLDQALALISDLQKKSQPATPSPSVAGTKPRPPLSAAKSMARSSPSSATTPKSSAKEAWSFI